MFGKKKQEVSRVFIFEEMTPIKAVLTLAIPTIVNQLVNVIYNLADTFYVGQLNNPSMVAALSLAAPVMIMLTGTANLFVVGGCALIAKALGAKDIEKARQLATLCPLMAFCVACVLSFLSITFIEPFAYYAGAIETNFEYTRDYLFWVFGMNAIPSIVGVTLGAGLRGRGYSKYEMIGITSGNILNIILDPVFIFGFNMGVKGAAIATFISTCFSLVFFIFMAFYMQRKENLYMIKGFKLDLGLAKAVVSTGFPAALHQILASVTNVMFMNLLKAYSDACIAGMGIVRKLEHVAGQVVIGMNQGIIPLVSYNYGNKNYQRLSKCRYTALFITFSFGLIAVLVLVPFSNHFIHLFIEDPETIVWGSRFLKIYAFLPLTMAINNNCRTVFQALGYKSYSTTISFTRNLVLFVPAMYILNHFFGISGLIFVAIVCDICVDTLAIFLNNNAMKKVKAEIGA